MKTLSVGLAGCGFAGSIHSRALNLIKASSIAKQVEIELKICVDTDEPRAKACSTQYGWQEHSTSLDDLFNKKLDLLLIALPNSEHLSVVQKADELGIFVLLEKPLSSDMREARSIAEITSRTHKMRVAYVYRFVPAVFQAKKLIDKGHIGDTRTITSNYLLNMRKPNGPSDWRFNSTLAGNGASDDLGSHHVDLIRYLIDDFEEAFAITKTWKIPNAPIATNDDLMMAIYKLKNDAHGTMIASRTTPGHPLTSCIEIHGSKGSLKIDRDYLNELFLYDSSGNESKIKVRPPDEYAKLWASPTVQGLHPFSWYDCFAFQLAEIVRVASGLQETFKVSATLDDGLRAMEIIEDMASTDMTDSLRKL